MWNIKSVGYRLHMNWNSVELYRVQQKGTAQVSGHIPHT